eukprot:4647-Eustigmatos_ZCMA.PRE.1
MHTCILNDLLQRGHRHSASLLRACLASSVGCCSLVSVPVCCAGVVEYRTLDDMKDAMRLLHDTELRGPHVKLYEVTGALALRVPV